MPAPPASPADRRASAKASSPEFRITLLEVPDGGQCCGSAGIYTLVQPESAIRSARARWTTCSRIKADCSQRQSGCTLQIRKILRERGQDLAAAPPIEILDASITEHHFRRDRDLRVD